MKRLRTGSRESGVKERRGDGAGVVGRREARGARREAVTANAAGESEQCRRA